MDDRLDNPTYYDAMAPVYERERHRGYHVFLDDSEVGAVADIVRGADVLEVGCGTGLLMERLGRLARRVAGVDLSTGMLRIATARTRSVARADCLDLPFADCSFDCAVSFKVLPHVEDIRRAVAEMARVVRPGGYIAAEFYNKWSLRSLLKLVKPATAISSGVSDQDVFTRYDSPGEALSYLPDEVEPIGMHGIRIAVPFAGIMKVPVLGRAVAAQERLLGKTPLRRLGGFLVVLARKKSGAAAADTHGRPREPGGGGR